MGLLADALLSWNVSFVHTLGCSHIATDAFSYHLALPVLDSANIAELSHPTGFICVGDTTLLRQRVMPARLPV